MIGKFSYGWTELENLRVKIPKKLKIKDDCLLKHTYTNEIQLNGGFCEHIIQEFVLYHNKKWYVISSEAPNL